MSQDSSPIGVRQFHHAGTSFQKADAQGYNVVATMLRVALHVAHRGIASRSATSVSTKRLETLTKRSRYFVDKFQRHHMASDMSLKRFRESITSDRVTREAYQSLNIYIFARQNTRVYANQLL